MPTCSLNVTAFSAKNLPEVITVVLRYLDHFTPVGVVRHPGAHAGHLSLIVFRVEANTSTGSVKKSSTNACSSWLLPFYDCCERVL